MEQRLKEKQQDDQKPATENTGVMFHGTRSYDK